MTSTTYIPDEAVQEAQEEYRNQAKINNWGSSWPSFESMESIVSAAVDHLPKTGVIITEKSIYEAAKRSYEYEGDRKGIYYVGFDNEPDDVQQQWKDSVKEAISGAIPYLSLKKTNELDAITRYGLDVEKNIDGFYESVTYQSIKGEYVFHSEAAKIIAAKDAEIEKLKRQTKTAEDFLYEVSRKLGNAEAELSHWKGEAVRQKQCVEQLKEETVEQCRKAVRNAILHMEPKDRLIADLCDDAIYKAINALKGDSNDKG